ncbi:MAG: hypothetical protein Q7R52_03950 [archaeon]|nr:hypothetical protein [archaeon]
MDFYTAYLEEHSFAEILEEINQQEIKIKEQEIIARDYIQLPSGIRIAKESSYFDFGLDDAHTHLFAKNLRVPTMRETWDLLFFAKENLSNPELEKIYNYGHGEWQNAIFRKGTGFNGLDLNITNPSNSSIDPSITPLEKCIWEACYVDISSPKYINSQGLPTKKASKQKDFPGETIYYYPPKEDCLAYFSASDKTIKTSAILYCASPYSNFYNHKPKWIRAVKK